MSFPADKTLVAVLTPPARGAIATVAVRGPQAVSLADRFFHSLGGKTLGEANVGKILVGHWQAAEEEVGEELVAAKLEDDYVEIHCHGGVQASERIVNHLQSAGGEPVSFTAWAGYQAPDSIVWEAERALPSAPTEQAALHLLDQHQGALSREVTSIQALFEAEQWDDAQQRLDALLHWAPFGLHLTNPWSIVLAGPPNVGKSSLLNKLIGYDRAIVLDMPGTTRDVLHAMAALDGWPVQFSDTAGIRISEDEIEQAGITKAKAALEQADLVLVLHDATDLRPHELDDSLRELPAALHVVNKIDLAADLALPDTAEMLATSAVTGQGVLELISAIVARLVPQRPEPGQAVPFTPRQVACFQQTRTLLAERSIDAARETFSQLLNLLSPSDETT
ncbi:GTPase [Blastopirellula marina]|uniref:TrmE-type G domain-containing protein n=1 Tax=Blastopirellula marina TaxID=124 RepID=A0A2S8GKE8_9BACT|nr:GTPase [Blastopirellula marina]PQO44919.1 hypothetical protein C5Y93_17675 [Blastopirellula marina]